MRGIYIVGRYPNQAAFIESFKNINDAGFEFIEIGLPFNDPVADGPVISEAAHSVIDKDITPEEIINDIISLKELSIKKYIMTYANIIYAYGIKKFSSMLKDHLTGLILADVPNRLAKMFYEEGLEIPIVPFATPETREEDILAMKDSQSEFIYFVGIRGITGSKADLTDPEITEKVKKIQDITGKKVIIGFGIKNKEDAHSALAISNGYVVGTEAVRRQGTEDFKPYIEGLL